MPSFLGHPPLGSAPLSAPHRSIALSFYGPGRFEQEVSPTFMCFPNSRFISFIRRSIILEILEGTVQEVLPVSLCILTRRLTRDAL